MAVASFFRYCGRFAQAYRTSFAWGRDNLLIAGLLGVAAILAGWTTGQIDGARVWADSQPVVYLYLGLLAAYAAIQLPVTAWRLDRRWEEDAGLLVDLYAYVSNDDDIVRLLVTNKGPRDVFSAEIGHIQGVAESNMIVESLPARWSQGGTDPVSIASGDHRTLELASFPSMKRDDEQKLVASPITFHSIRDVAVRSRFAWGADVYFGVTVRSETTGLAKSQAMRLIVAAASLEVLSRGAAMQQPQTTDVPTISVNPDVLKWARTERGLSRADAADLLKIAQSELDDYESGAKKPMVSVLRSMSAQYEINFVSLLLPQPPAPVEKLQDFRTQTNRVPRALTHETLIAIQDVRDALDAFAELKATGPGHVVLPRLDTVERGESASDLAARQRRRFRVSVKEQWKWPSPAFARDEWRRMIEGQGVFVYLKPMNLKDCRGFSIMRDGLAAICINDREENAGAETFTLLHEYCHLLLRSTGISDENRVNATEQYCNSFAASFLIPTSQLREYLKSPVKPVDYGDEVVKRLANKFKVSMRAMALRLEETELAPNGYYAKRTAPWDIPKQKKPGSVIKGPTAVDRAAKMLGKQHTKTVLRAYNGGFLSASDAHGLLDVPVPSFGHLSAAVE